MTEKKATGTSKAAAAKDNAADEVDAEQVAEQVGDPGPGPVPATADNPRGQDHYPVNPSNELQDGDALGAEAPPGTVISEAGTALVHEDDRRIPPPASANLEHRKRQEKQVAALSESIGETVREDDHVSALQEERRGWAARADAGDEKAAGRLEQIDEQIKHYGDAAKERAKASGGQRDAAPQGRTAPPEGKAKA